MFGVVRNDLSELAFVKSKFPQFLLQLGTIELVWHAIEDGCDKKVMFWGHEATQTVWL